MAYFDNMLNTMTTICRYLKLAIISKAEYLNMANPSFMSMSILNPELNTVCAHGK